LVDVVHDKETIDHWQKHWKKNPTPGQFYRYPLDGALLRYTDREYDKKPKDEKIFLVDTTNKIVEACPWAAKKNFCRGQITYKDQEFILDQNKNLTLVQNYTVEDSYMIGGVWINGRARGYLSGGQSMPYTRKGYETYIFCTRTNKFLGYQGCKEEARKGWQEYKGRW
jgi:hypothetical protein